MAARSFLLKNERILPHFIRYGYMSNIRPQVFTYSNQPSSKKADETIDNEPVQFSSSKAAQFNSEESTLNTGRTNRPPFEPLLVRISVLVFMLYFCVLREENDWDKAIEASLVDTVPDMEIIMLREKKKFDSERDPFTEADRLRLEKLEKELTLSCEKVDTNPADIV